MKALVDRAVIIILVLASIGTGWFLRQNTQQPEYVVQREVIPGETIVVEKPVIERIREPVFIDRIRYIERDVGVAVRFYNKVYQNLTDWQSVDELKAFLETDDTNENVIIKAAPTGEIKFEGACEDYALQLRERAAAIGKNLEVIAIDKYEYNKWLEYMPDKKTINDPSVYHAMNMARIGNEFWYVEPQTDAHWLALYLD